MFSSPKDKVTFSNVKYFFGQDGMPVITSQKHRAGKDLKGHQIPASLPLHMKQSNLQHHT